MAGAGGTGQGAQPQIPPAQAPANPEHRGLASDKGGCFCLHRLGGLCPPVLLSQPRTAPCWLRGFWGDAEVPRRDFCSCSRFLAGAVGVQLPVMVAPGWPHGDGGSGACPGGSRGVDADTGGGAAGGFGAAGQHSAGGRSWPPHPPCPLGHGTSSLLPPGTSLLWGCCRGCPPPRCPRGGQGPGVSFSPPLPHPSAPHKEHSPATPPHPSHPGGDWGQGVPGHRGCVFLFFLGGGSCLPAAPPCSIQVTPNLTPLTAPADAAPNADRL